MIIVGKSEAALVMIQDILESNSSFPVLEIINNLKIFSTKEYIHTEFKISEREDWGVSKDGYVLGALLPQTKMKIFEAFEKVYGVEEYINLFHKLSHISQMATISNGGLFDAHCYVSAFAKLGNFVSVYNNSTISHHCVIGDYVTLCPNSSLAGNVEVGSGTLIGIGACVKNGVKIGSNCIIGAGAVVVKDIPDNSTVKGNPAK